MNLSNSKVLVIILYIWCVAERDAMCYRYTWAQMSP